MGADTTKVTASMLLHMRGRPHSSLIQNCRNRINASPTNASYRLTRYANCSPDLFPSLSLLRSSELARWQPNHRRSAPPSLKIPANARIRCPSAALFACAASFSNPSAMAISSERRFLSGREPSAAPINVRNSPVRSALRAPLRSS